MTYSLKRLEAAKAAAVYAKYQESGLLLETDNELRSLLYEDVLNAMRVLGETDDQKKKYAADLEVGLCLYRLLPDSKIGMRLASDTGFWRYLSLMVLPDLVQLRYPGKAERFWKHKRRIWLKAVWWYIYLSWQGSEESTRSVLAGNSTDDIVQLVERSGRNGYRVSLYREIMRQSAGRSSSQSFRVVMKINTARLVTTEPSLTVGGVEGYVSRLYDSVG